MHFIKNSSQNLCMATLLALVLTACGQKGPLYLPQPNQPAPASAAPVSNTPSATATTEKNNRP